MNNDNPSNLIPPAVAALATVVNAASNNEAQSQSQEGTAVKAAPVTEPVSAAPAQVVPVSAAVSAQNPVSAPTQVAPVSSAAPAQLAPTAASAVLPVLIAATSEKNPAATAPAQNLAPTQNIAPAQKPAAPVVAQNPGTVLPASAPPNKPLPLPQPPPQPPKINQDTIKNAINNSLTKYPLEISDENGEKYKMIISSDFSKLDPVFPSTATELFQTKISKIQKAINDAVSCINMEPKLYMKVTVQEANQSGGSGSSSSSSGVGGNKKMRQTKKMKKRKH